MKKIFITSQYPGESVKRLSEKYDVVVYPKSTLPTHEELLENAKDSVALITTVADVVNKKLIDCCPDLKIVFNSGVGYENVDIPYASEKGIFVTNTPNVLTETTADLAWALMFSVARRIIEADTYVREGQFACGHPSLLLGMNIHEKTLGVYGMGRIGSAVARRAKGFNMRVIYQNRNNNQKAEDETGAEFVDFETLLKESDFIVITAPLTEETRGRFGQEEFQKMKSTSIIVNVGRGPIIKEAELASALKDGLIWGAGLDVFENEPQVNEELLNLKNTVLVPHIGSASVETREKMVDMAVTSVELALRGEVPKYLVNPEVIKTVEY
ncbi:MAG: D-glycerate dehydrogenase [Thermodesulfobacteriales bacterium]|nr:MAG: D-glycerate dehydrogenase [Thermodesulfobacteriales bacterium]